MKLIEENDKTMLTFLVSKNILKISKIENILKKKPSSQYLREKIEK